MLFETRALDLIKAVTNKETGDHEQRIIDSFFSKRNDLTNRLEFVQDRTNPTLDEKAHVFIEAFRLFGETTVAGQARLEMQDELKSEFLRVEDAAKKDFEETI